MGTQEKDFFISFWTGCTGVAADSRPFNRPFCSVMQQNVNMERTRNSLLEQGRKEGGPNCLLGDSYCQIVSILCFKHVRVTS